MKKLAIICLVASVGTMFVSCSTGGASLKDNKDSVAYAVGSSLGSMAFNLDSTLNVDVIVSAIKDVYAKNPKVTQEEAQQLIQNYMMKRDEVARAEQETAMQEKAIANATEQTEFLAKKEAEGAQKTASGLLYKIEKAGAATKIAVGDSATVNYVLTFPNGDKKDSSYDRNQPFTTLVDTNNIIAGFVEGLTLVGEGGKITLYIPSDLAYGDQGGQMGEPKKALQFEIEVLKVKQNAKK